MKSEMMMMMMSTVWCLLKCALCAILKVCTHTMCTSCEPSLALHRTVVTTTTAQLHVQAKRMAESEKKDCRLLLLK